MLHAVDAPARSEHYRAVLALRLLLMVRILWNVSFCLLLVTRAPDSLADLLRLFSRFAFVDGALALLVAGGYLTVTPSRMLWMSPTIDAATRALLVGLLLVGPGISEFPLTALLYVGLIATFASFDGLLDLMEGLTLRRELGQRGGGTALIVSGSCLAVLGATLFATTPDAREVGLVLALLSATHAIAFVPAMSHLEQLRMEPHAK